MTTHAKQVLALIVISGLVITLTSVGTRAQDKSPKPAAKEWVKGYIAAPPGSETLNTALEAPALQLFSDADFRGTEVTLSHVDQTIGQGKVNEMPKGLNDSISSLRWNLPRGAIVVLYEDAAAKGEQTVLWGS